MVQRIGVGESRDIQFNFARPRAAYSKG